MWAVLCNFLFVFLLLDGGQKVIGAPSADWPDRYLEKEYAGELYNLLQNYWSENRVPSLMTAKRNSEIINSLLALPKNMADVGR